MERSTCNGVIQMRGVTCRLNTQHALPMTPAEHLFVCTHAYSECGLMITSGKVKGGRNADYRWVNVAESNGLANPRFTHPAVLKVGATEPLGRANRGTHAHCVGMRAVE